MNITQLRESIEHEIADNDAHITSARSEIERLISEAELSGRATLTTGADVRANALYADIQRLSAANRRQEARLARAKEIEDETAEQEKRLLEVRDTNAGMRNRGQTAAIPAGGGAGVLYGAGGSAESTGQWMDAATGRNAALARGQRFSDHEVVRDEMARNAERDKILTGTHGTFAQQVRSLSTTGSAGVVPTVWSSAIIDKVRNHAVCLNAGVTVVPMPAKVYQIGRLNADVAPAFKTEGSAINVSDPGFDFVQLTATTLGSLTVASIEFLADAPNADAVLQESVAKAMALEIDKAVLFGGVLTGDGSEGYNLPAPYPRGVLKTLLTLAAGNILGNATNGTVQTSTSFFRELQSLVYSVKRRNEVCGALVSNDAMVQKYVDTYDSTNRPLAMPDNLKALPWLTTNAIASATQGTGTTMSDVFAGDWSQVLLGQRLGIEIRVLTERYAELGQVGILAYWRGDVQLARLSAMGVYRYLQAAV